VSSTTTPKISTTTETRVSPRESSPVLAKKAPTRTRVSFSCLAKSTRCSETGAVISPMVSTARLNATRYSTRCRSLISPKRWLNGSVSRNPASTWMPVWATRSSWMSSSQLRSARSLSVSSRPFTPAI